MIKSKGNRIYQVVRYTIMIVLGIIMVFPLYWICITSLKSSGEIFSNPPVFLPSNPEWGNFIEVFKQLPFLKWIINTFFVSIVITVIALLTHSMSGYALARLNFKGRNKIFIFMISTLMIPFASIMVPLFIIIRQLGWYDSYLALIVPAIPNAFGIFLMRQFYLGIPKELEEASRLDGCSIVGTFFKIILPISKPMLAALAVFFFIANWNSFLWPMIVTSSESMKLIQVGIASYAGDYYNPWAYIMAANTVALIPTLFIFIFLQKQLMTSITMSGIKS
ncbi:MAG: multiple sugar transport system permease protein [Kosmotogales bacterium]|nr:multiple sugar transport system permease protein [Kosmotogales bacterium]